MEILTVVSGKMTLFGVKVLSILKMGTNMKVVSLMAHLKVMELLILLVLAPIKVVLVVEIWMGSVDLIIWMVRFMMEIGKKIRNMEEASSLKLMGYPSIMEIGTMILSMVKEPFFKKVLILSKEFGIKAI